MKKTQRQLADEAYLRMNTQVGRDGALPGQIDAIDGTVAGARADLPTPVIDEVPSTCPYCSKAMTMQSGWSLIAGANALVGVIMCGDCGTPLTISRSNYETLRLAIRAHFDAIKAKNAPLPKAARAKRDRGAG